MNSIAAVVVTRNRLPLLRRCLKAIASQTHRPDEVIVVDNASTDGTSEWLESQPVVSIRQANEGSAGGFASGLQYALRESPCSRYWLLDDDAAPTDTCLEMLLCSNAARDARNVLGSIAISDQDPETLAFKVPVLASYSRRLDWYRQLTDDVEYVVSHSSEMGYEWAMLFNSIIISRAMVQHVGVPRSELFIWGDEVEYLYRLRSGGYSTFLIPGSIVLHPKARQDKSPPRWKEMYRVRNYVYIHRTYMKVFPLRLALRVAQIVTSRRLWLFRPLWDGVRGDLSTKYHEAPVTGPRSSIHPE